MSLRDALKREPQRPHRSCGVAGWIATLSEDEQDAAHALLADSARTSSSVCADFRAEGFRLMDNTVRKHRAGTCSCVS